MEKNISQTEERRQQQQQSNVESTEQQQQVSGEEQTISEPTLEFFNKLVMPRTHTLLGRTGFKVSRICLGSMNFGEIDPKFGDRPGQLNQEEAHKILDRYYELGGNCIDTANFFPWFGSKAGESERIIGEWLNKSNVQRENVFLITKIRMPTDPQNINSGGLSLNNIINSVETCLKRLNTNYIDLLQINGWDPTVSVFETVKNLENLIHRGLVRYIGVCDLKGWQIQKLIDYSRMGMTHKPVCYEGEYNLLTRGVECEIVDICRHEHIGFFAYSPLKYGYITDEYNAKSDSPVKGSRIEAASRDRPNLAAMAEPFEEIEKNPQYSKLLDVCQRIGKEKNLTTAQIGLLWVLQQSFVTSVVTGVSSVKELEENMSCLSSDVMLTQEEMCELNQVSTYPVQYPYTSFASLAGYKELRPSIHSSFEQMSLVNEPQLTETEVYQTQPCPVMREKEVTVEQMQQQKMQQTPQLHEQMKQEESVESSRQ